MENTPHKNIVQNRKARYEYIIHDRVEAGIVLTGTEIKSVRNYKVSLDGAYAKVERGEVWLYGVNIDEYSHGNTFNHDPKRKRKLLLRKREISKFAEKAEQKGFSIVPLRVYLSKGIAKVELAVCQGKKLYDKRQAIKRREVERELRK